VSIPGRVARALGAVRAGLSSTPVRRRLAGLGAVCGTLLVVITPNPPETPVQWVQVGVGSVVGAWSTILAFAPREAGERRPPGGGSGSRWAWFVRHPWRTGTALLLTALLVFAGSPLVEVLRGPYQRVVGCTLPAQLRVVAEPETVMTARELAAAYELRSAADGHGCPTAQVHVFAATLGAVAERLESTDGWSEGAGAFSRIGPQPDVWLASTSHAVSALRIPDPAGPPRIAERFTVARSPLVLAVPGQAGQPETGWATLVRQLEGGGQGVVRADPTSSRLGLLATALLYDSERASSAAGVTEWPPRSPAEIERRLDAGRDAADLPVGDTADLLCRRREPPANAGGPAPATIIATEQAVARYNAGRPLGGSCGAAPAPAADRRLTALYPTDTGDQDLQFVRFGWSDPAQQRAASAFGAWLGSDAGRDALVRTGLRPTGTHSLAAPLTTAFGVDPTRSPSSGPVAESRLSAAAASYTAAQRPSRLLFVFDTSGSMATPGPGGTRGTIAADAVQAGLARLGGRDEFGLWFFPGGDGGGHTEAVAVGATTPERLAAARTALDGVAPAGGTPLLRSVVDGVTALSPRVLRTPAPAAPAPDDPSAADPVGVRALVVLTDGEDTSSGITADDAAFQILDKGVRVVVVTLGEIRCTGEGLRGIVGTSGGDCVDADTSTVGERVAEIVDELKGGG
jgi:hypothetical protein